MRYATIAATSAFVPPIEMTNAELRARFEGQKAALKILARMEESTGIATRFYAPQDWATSDLAARAGAAALAGAGIGPQDVDLVVVGTDSPDYVTPATSAVVQHKLGAKRAGTFDVGCGCASFPTALAAASGIVSTNACIRNVLVIGVYLMHRLCDPNDPILFLYGDGAGAVVLRPSDRPGFVGAAFGADGSYADKWAIHSGGTVEPASEASVRAGRTCVRMRETIPKEVNEDGWPEIVRRLALEAGFSLRDVDLFLFSQIRRKTIECVMERLEQPLERAHLIMQKWGYTGSACIPMALDDALATKKAKPGDLVVMVGSGIGYNQAAAAIRL
jgi:3-oxoacyl-[acyl-carrier-protein] synthase-3